MVKRTFRLIANGASAEDLESLRHEFVASVSADRVGGVTEAGREFDRMVEGARPKIGRSGEAASHDIHRSSDVANAERFVKAHSDKMKYVDGLGWHAWVMTNWSDDADLQAQERGKETARSIRAEANSERVAGHPESADALEKHWRASQSAARIRSMLDLARSDPQISILPRQLDAHPELLNLRNGVLDLSTGKLLRHDPKLLLTRLADVDYTPGASAPYFDRLLSDMCGDDDDLQRFLIQAFGLCLTPRTDEQYLFFLFGDGANRKTTLLNAVSGVLGDYSVHLEDGLLAAAQYDKHTTGLFDVLGARMVVAAEVEAGKPLAESKVKRMTGGDPITARPLYRDNVRFDPTHKLWISDNHRPVISGTDTGIWRRILLIEIKASFEGAVADKSLGQKLRAERPGILNRLLDGLSLDRPFVDWWTLFGFNTGGGPCRAWCVGAGACRGSGWWVVGGLSTAGLSGVRQVLV